MPPAVGSDCPYDVRPWTLTRRTLVKVPEVTALFWVAKLLTRPRGRSTSDYLVKVLDPVPAVVIGTLVLLGVIAFQVTRDRYIPWVYWWPC